MSESVIPQTTNGKRPAGVQVIARAAQILRTLHEAPDGLTLSELAQQVGLARTSVYRIVQALQTEGLVTRTAANGTVRLGLELGRLATSTSGSLVRSLRPFLERLAQEVNETVDLAVLYGTEVRFIDQVVPGRRLRAQTVVGEVYPAHCTANGKVLLAALPPATLEAVLPQRLKKYTANTLVQRAELLAELAEVRSAGIAFDREEHDLRVCAVGAVVSDALGARAAITIAVPSERFYDREAELSEALRDVARAASTALGACAEPAHERPRARRTLARSDLLTGAS